MSEREICDEMCRRMNIGESMCFSRQIFHGAYPCGWPSIYNTHIEAFLSSKVGSAWGCWTCRMDIISGNYIVSRNKEGNKRVYCDPDRRHLFKEVNGYLEPR